MNFKHERGKGIKVYTVVHSAIHFYYREIDFFFIEN